MMKIHESHLADLRKSGLSDETIKLAGFETVHPDQINRELGFNNPNLISIYRIPYEGGFARFRCFYEDELKKPMKGHPKYLQRRGTGNHLYFPLNFNGDKLQDPSAPIYFTEGEKKSLKACQEGLLCIGISGLWSWKEKGKKLIPDFDKINFKDRNVYIVPDNDYKKPDKHGYEKNLGKAVKQLAFALSERGAKVSIIELPDGPEKGIDDYFLSHTVTDFYKLPVTNVSIPSVDDEKKKQPEPTKTERLIDLALNEAELFHDDNLRAYATIRIDGHRETYSLRSKGFRIWLSGRLWKINRDGCGLQIMQDALGTLEAYAIHEGSCHAVHVRVAEHKGRLYIDLGSDRFDVVEIGPDGWLVLNNQNIVKFRRPSGMASLPYPKEGGCINTLNRYVNLANSEDWPLIVGFILGCFHPSGPYTILAVTGEQGSAKSTLLKVIKALTDPSTAPLRSTPKESRDLAISANNNWNLAFDNLSDISVWLSDALCRLATGSGFATRTLYSDDDETIFNVKRPVMLNGIDNVIRNHDLADRGIIINLAVIQEERRIPENEFWNNFEDDAPEILGAIFDAVSCALRNVETVYLASYPRMADFARWVTAAEETLGWEGGTFLNAYRQNIREISSLTLDADLVGATVILLMADKIDWEGTATELLNAMENAADERTKKAKGWPGAAHVLSGKLRRSATALRAHGIEVILPKRKSKQKLIRLERVGEQSVTSVIERKPAIHHAEMNNKYSMTLPTDQSVIGGSHGHEENHTDRMNDASFCVNDAGLIGDDINKKPPTADILTSCETRDARDGHDASTPPILQNDDLLEGVI